MRLKSFSSLVLLVCLTAMRVGGAPASTPVTAAVAAAAEQRALAGAEQSFQLGLWERAEHQFAAFAEKFPKSESRAQALLREGQAQLKQGKFNDAVELLTTRQKEAGALAGEYQFWIGEGYFGSTNYPAAAEAYTKLTKSFTNSLRLLEASYDAALARSKSGDWARVDDLLRGADGAFQAASQRDPTNDFVVRGTLLLAEAQLSQGDLRAAEGTLLPLGEQKGNPELEWRRQYLLCRVQIAGDRSPEALQTVSNLTDLAMAAGRRDLQAETTALRGGILERMRQYDEAIAAYESNLSEDLPVERRRQAVLKIVELQLARNKVAAAAQRLEKFLGDYSRDAAMDVALLTVGELHLKEYLASPETNRVVLTATNLSKTFPTYTNHLQQAYAQFDWIVNNFPRSSSLGKAMLDRAWCLWLSGQIAEARTAFRQAAEKLPASADQALARYKWADCQMVQDDFSGALTNYEAVLNGYASMPGVRSDLAEPALYQIVRASLQLNDMASATNALGVILANYPDSFYCDRGMLLTGEKLSHAGQPTQAREIFNIALKRPGMSPLSPVIQLAVARTYEQENNWIAAAAEYERWLNDFTNDPARPEAEYAHAWAMWRGGRSSEALAAFNGFVTKYPTHELAPLAQNWIADFYLQAGDFKDAEANYQLLFQKWPPSALTYSARLMAGRAALAQGNYDEAISYFTKLINDKSTPPEFVAQAFFEYGDANTGKVTADTNSALANFSDAIVIFSRIPQLYPTNDLAALAWGRIGNCYLQLGQLDAGYYTNAVSAYQKVLESARAGVTPRSQAEVGLGDALEKEAAQKVVAERGPLLKQALDHYLNVALGTNLRGQEQGDPFWLKRAGLEAARMAENMGQWQQALNLYQRLEEWLPSLKGMLDKKMGRVREHLAQEKIDMPKNGG